MKIGLYGGSFDPVHIGHMAVAKAAKEQFGLDRVIFIPTGNMPHKKGCVASSHDRIEMLKLSFDDPSFEVSDYEVMRTDISYSADTVEHFKSLYPDDELYFIIGGDSYAYIDKWYQPERIFKNATVLVFPRNGEKILPPARELNVREVPVSSSKIREKIKMKKNVSNLLKKEVFDYIIVRTLYQ
ncbi:MAG: nicotinate (nicotinamide) nucleotide adenylyltransferase [Clostridia bacterium]